MKDLIKIILVLTTLVNLISCEQPKEDSDSMIGSSPASNQDVTLSLEGSGQ